MQSQILDENNYTVKIFVENMLHGSFLETVQARSYNCSLMMVYIEFIFSYQFC